MASMTATYPAIIELTGSGFSVYFPDLPGCTSAGATIEEAAANAGEALAGHLAVLADAGETVPAPSPLGATGQDREGSEVVRVMVTAAD